MPKTVKLTDFERDVAIGLIETALAGWEDNLDRQAAAQRVVDKLRAVDEVDE